MTLKLAGLGVLAVVAMLMLMPTQASATASFSLTESSSTMTYGQSTPTFRATLTVPAGDPGPAGNNPPVLMVGSTGYPASVSGTGPTYNLFWSGFDSTALAPGDHSLVAVYQSPVGGAIDSNPVALTVLKSTPQLTCTLTTSAAAYTYASGAAYSVEVGSQFAGDQFTISFAGAQQFASGPVIADSSGRVLTNVPAVAGTYQTTCEFDGSATQNATTFNMGQTVVSLQNQPSIALYASPTPLVTGTSTTWRVVVSGGAGTPTGRVGLTIGANYVRGSLYLSGGAVTFTATAPPMAATNRVQVGYYGDPVYSSAVVYFPLNPPPIPGSGSAVETTSAPASPAGQPLGSPTGSPAAATSSLSPSSSQLSLPSPSSFAKPTTLAHTVAAAVTGSGSHSAIYVIAAIALTVTLICAAMFSQQVRVRRPRNR